MSRLPIVGADGNGWGAILNDFLGVSLDASGFLKDSISTNQMVNVKDSRYGALGDGTTNDATAIQSALTALQGTGGAIYFPPGTYFINASRLIYSSTAPIALIGSGWASRFLWSAATDSPAQNKGMLNISGTGNADALHCTKVIIRDLAFDFGSSRATAYDGDKRGINIYNADDVLIQNCYLKGARAETVGVGNFGSPTTPGNRCWILNNTFFDFAQDGANSNNFDSWVVNNFFLQGTVPFECGRDRIHVLGNTFKDMTSSGKIGSTTTFLVADNNFLDCATTDPGGQIGVILVAGQGSNPPATDGIIAGNAFSNTATFANQIGIFFTRGTSTSDHARIVLYNNTINGIRNGIFCTSLLDGEIVGNTLVGTGSGAGIVLQSGGQCLRTVVNGNNVRTFAARNVSPASNGPITDASGEAGLQVVGWNTQEGTLVLGATGRVDFANADTTPSVRRPAGIYYVANTGGTTITQLDDATIGQQVTLVFDDANTTINDGGNFALNGNFTSTLNDCLELVWTGLIWVERGRSVN